MRIQAASLYRGPADGLSQPDLAAQRWLKPAARVLHGVMVRQQVSGLDHLPEDGAQLFCPTHQSGIDAGLIMGLSNRDMRFMAAREQFNGMQGPILTKMGAFPVDRAHPGRTTLKHSVDVLKDGKALVIFPEGGIPSNGGDGKIGEFKEGPGWIAVHAGAESVVPITMHVGANQESRPLAHLTGVAGAAGLVALGLCGAAGGTAAQVATGVIGGALIGAFTGSRFAKPDPKTAWNPYPGFQQRTLNGLKGAAAGAAAGAVAALIPGGAAVAAVGGGLSSYGLARDFIERPVAKIEIGQPLKVSDYVASHGKKEAGNALMADLHTQMAATKARLVTQ
ncbi:MAG: lysophospholipid acyltransferase family protein [Vulcanimicrobiota bacterium]